MKKQTNTESTKRSIQFRTGTKLWQPGVGLSSVHAAVPLFNAPRLINKNIKAFTDNIIDKLLIWNPA